MVAEGHTLCNHSWDHHSPFDTLSRADLDQEIGQTQNAIAQATGVTARYFRAPEGRFGDPGGAVLQAASAGQDGAPGLGRRLAGLEEAGRGGHRLQRAGRGVPGRGHPAA